MEVIHQPDNEIRIVLVGATEYAKNTVARILLPEEKFKCLPKKTELHTRKITIESKEYKVDIINTTPVVDYRPIPDDKKIYEIYKAVALSSPGPHVFVLCIPASKINAKFCNAIKHFEDLFGDDIYEFVIVAFTHFDEYHKYNDEPSIHIGIKEKLFEKELDDAIAANKVLKKIMNVTKDYIVLDSYMNSSEKEKKFYEIFDIIRRMESQNKSKYATCVLSEYAEKELNKRISDRKSETNGKILRDEVKKSNEYIDYFSNRTCK